MTEGQGVVAVRRQRAIVPRRARRWIARALSVCAALAVAVAPAAAQKREPDSNLELVAEDDAEMNAAIAGARALLPAFWAASGGQGWDSAQLKAGLVTDDGGVEHIWVAQPRLVGGRVHGVLSNEPVHMRALRLGDPVTFEESQISDWMIVRGGRIYGSFTTRVLIARMDPAERAAYAAMERAFAEGPPP